MDKCVDPITPFNPNEPRLFEGSFFVCVVGEVNLTSFIFEEEQP